MKSKLIEPLRKIYGSEQAVLEASYAHRDIDKEYALRTKGKTRGSTRINEGLFFSRRENEEWRENAKKTSLP